MTCQFFIMTIKKNFRCEPCCRCDGRTLESDNWRMDGVRKEVGQVFLASQNTMTCQQLADTKNHEFLTCEKHLFIINNNLTFETKRLIPQIDIKCDSVWWNTAVFTKLIKHVQEIKTILKLNILFFFQNKCVNWETSLICIND